MNHGFLAQDIVVMLSVRGWPVRKTSEIAICTSVAVARIAPVHGFTVE